jgi:dienelactone hydrolase
MATSAGAQSAESPEFQPLRDRGIECTDIVLKVGDHQLRTVLASPPKEKLAKDPVLLLTIGRSHATLVPPMDQAAKYFLDRGHRAVGLTVSSVESSLEVFRDRVLEGAEPVDAFIRDAQALIDYCVKNKLAKRDRIVVVGVSRNGYLAFRLLASDKRLKYGGGFAPVTDWRDLLEFKYVQDSQTVADLRLERYAKLLTGKTLFMAIGYDDRRVGTLSCTKFFSAVAEANHERKLDSGLARLFVTTDEDHSCSDEWYERGSEYLLNAVTASDEKSEKAE